MSGPLAAYGGKVTCRGVSARSGWRVKHGQANDQQPPRQSEAAETVVVMTYSSRKMA